MVDFVFVMVRSPPGEEKSPDMDVIWTKVFPYVYMRHSDIAEIHWVLCIRDALTIMVNKMLLSGETINRVHVYSHSMADGFFWGRLSSPQEDYRDIPPDELEKYQSEEFAGRALEKYTSKNTEVHIHGCHLGVSPQSVTCIRNIFGASKGIASAPRTFQNFCADTEFILREYRYGDGSIIQVPSYPEIRENGDTVMRPANKIKNRAQFNYYVKGVIDGILAKEPKAKEARVKQIKEHVSKLYDDDLNNKLYQLFTQLKNGEELPWQDIYTLSKNEIIDKMRSIFFSGRLARTYLSHIPLDSCSREELTKLNFFNVWPYQQFEWYSQHTWEPPVVIPDLVLKKIT